MPLLSDRVRDRLPWRQLLVESVLVVMSVLLALALNAWYDHSQEQEKVRRALRGLHAELVENRKRLQFRVSHHRALLDTFRTDSLSFRKPLSLRNIDINTQAWETAQQTGTIGLMDYEVASRVSGAYAEVDNIEFLSRKIFDVLLDGTTFLGYTPNDLGDFDGLLNDLTNVEAEALRQTTRALDAIEARMPALARSSSDPAAADSTSAMGH